MIKIMTKIKQLIMTLVALFAMTTGAWADETVFEYADPMVGTLTQGTTGTSATTVKIHTNITTVNAIKFGNSYVYADGKYITIAPTSGSFKKGDVVSIAGCISTSTPEAYAKAGIYTADGATKLYETANVINGRDTNDDPTVETYTLTQDAEKLLIARSTGTTALYITTLKVLRTASAPAGIDLTPDATRKVWTLDKMPADNVELQVEYYPGMLVKPTNLVGGTMEIEGLTDTTLPEGFEKDDDGNIYVKKDTKFTVKAVPAEGYHLVAWSDDATNKELEREFTMTDDDFILTATFSDEYDLAFEALNANTIEDGKATVKVGDTDKTADIQDGKLSGVKYGQTVTITAATGYKFRKAEATKGISTLKSLKIGNYTVYYAEGETWYQALMRDENNNCGLETSVGYVFNYAEEPLLDSGGNNVSEGSLIDPSKGYHFAD